LRIPLGPDEYFYKVDSSNALDVGSDSQKRRPLGNANEFADAERRWLSARDRRRAAAALTTTTTTDDNEEQPSSMVNEGIHDQSENEQF
jgi:hypothetical protein